MGINLYSTFRASDPDALLVRLGRTYDKDAVPSPGRRERTKPKTRIVTHHDSLPKHQRDLATTKTCHAVVRKQQSRKVISTYYTLRSLQHLIFLLKGRL